MKTLKEILFFPSPLFVTVIEPQEFSIKVKIERQGWSIQYRHFQTMVCELATTEKI